MVELLARGRSPWVPDSRSVKGGECPKIEITPEILNQTCETCILS